MKYAVVLWILLGLFCLRVLGQFLVASFHVEFLPPMEAWHSGLLSYPLLLPSQILIICLCTKICVDFTRGSGYWVAPNKRIGTGLLVFGTVYLVVMIIRFFVFGLSIPVVFHWVLAFFLLTVSRYHRRKNLTS